MFAMVLQKQRLFFWHWFYLILGIHNILKYIQPSKVCDYITVLSQQQYILFNVMDQAIHRYLGSIFFLISRLIISFFLNIYIYIYNIFLSLLYHLLNKNNFKHILFNFFCFFLTLIVFSIHFYNKERKKLYFLMSYNDLIFSLTLEF